MKKSFRYFALAGIVLSVAWFGLHRIDAQVPAGGHGSQWDHDGSLALLQPPRGPGRGGDGGRPDDGRRGGGPPPPRDGQRPPPRPGEDGPDGRPPHGGPDGRPPRPGGGGRLEMEYLKEIDPEMAALIEQDHELDRETYRLAEAYRLATGARKTEMRASVTAVIDEHFEIRQQRRALELKRLEEELERLRDSIEVRTKAKDEIVKRRIAEVLEEDELRF